MGPPGVGPTEPRPAGGPGRQPPATGAGRRRRGRSPLGSGAAVTGTLRPLLGRYYRRVQEALETMQRVVDEDGADGGRSAAAAAAPHLLSPENAHMNLPSLADILGPPDAPPQGEEEAESSQPLPVPPPVEVYRYIAPPQPPVEDYRYIPPPQSPPLPVPPPEFDPPVEPPLEPPVEPLPVPPPNAPGRDVP